MFNLFSKGRSISLSVINIILNITTLIYLISLFGFNHLNKELLINAFTGMGLASVVLAIAVLVIAFIFYTSFKIAYKKIINNIEHLSKTITEMEKH